MSSSPLMYNLPNYQVGTAIALNTSFSLPWVPIYFLGYFVQTVWTGTPTGTFYLECSGDQYIVGTDIPLPQGAPFPTEAMKNPVNRVTIANSSYAVSAAGSNAWNVNGARYNFVRLSYTDSSSGLSTAQLTFNNISQKGPG